MTAMPTRKVTCNLARPAATKTNRVVAGARKAHGKTQQVATAAGVSVTVGTTVLAQVGVASRAQVSRDSEADIFPSLPSESARPLAFPNRVGEIFPFHILHIVFVCVCV